MRCGSRFDPSLNTNYIKMTLKSIHIKNDAPPVPEAAGAIRQYPAKTRYFIFILQYIDFHFIRHAAMGSKMNPKSIHQEISVAKMDRTPARGEKMAESCPARIGRGRMDPEAGWSRKPSLKSLANSKVAILRCRKSTLPDLPHLMAW